MAKKDKTIKGTKFNFTSRSEELHTAVAKEIIIYIKRDGMEEVPFHFVEVEGNGALDTFICAKYQTTQAQYKLIIGKNPSSYKEADPRVLPVESVSWIEATEFCNILTTALGGNAPYTLIYEKDECVGYELHDADGKPQLRLLSSEEWEYAAKGGTKSKGYKFAGSDNENEVSWTSNNAKHLMPVGLLKPNELGIYDMSGNVWEFTHTVAD